MATALGQFTPGALSGLSTTQGVTTSAAVVRDIPYETRNGRTVTMVDQQIPYITLSEKFAEKASSSGISVSYLRGVGNVVTPNSFNPTVPTAGEIEQYKAGNYPGFADLFNLQGGASIWPLILLGGAIFLLR